MLNHQEELRFCRARRGAIAREFSQLNPEQQKAVLATEGPLLLLAGAGSGKTTVLINRIANLMEYGRGSDSEEVPEWVTSDDLAFLEDYAAGKIAPAPEDKARQERLCRLEPAAPWTILAITFTNKAAGELKDRLAKMLGPEAEDVWASTFHSACVRILRRDIDRLGFASSFTIYDTDDSIRVIKDCLKDLNLDDKQFPPRTVLGYISRAKDAMKLAEEYLAECEKSGDYRLAKIAKIYVEYQRRLWEASALDFDDIILHTVRLLQQFEEVRSFYQRKFRYVLIDEYQDTNNLQYLLASTLAGGYENFCVVGDDDQSIYRFRGATIENILSFEKQYPACRTIRLEENYRSTKHILEASNAVIRNNQGRKGKELWTKAGEGEKLHLYTAMNESDEAQYVAARILEDYSQGIPWKDHAVLYRMNAQSNQMEQAFKRNGVPYRIIGGTRFFDRAEVKDMIAYLAVLNNPGDDLRLTRIINNPPRGIGLKTVETAQEVARRENTSLYAVIDHARQYPELERSAGKLAVFTSLMAELRELLGKLPLDQFYEELIVRTGYGTMLETKNTVEDRTRLENVRELLTSIRGYLENAGDEPSLAGFLDEIALYTDLDSHDPDQDCVVMMPGGLCGGGRGGHLPRHPGHRGAGRDGGGAAALLRGHDPGQGEALPHLRQPAHALRPHQLQPALPLFGGDPSGAPGAVRSEFPGPDLRLGGRPQPRLRIRGLWAAGDLRRGRGEPLRSAAPVREPPVRRGLRRLCPGHVRRRKGQAQDLRRLRGAQRGSRGLPQGGHGPAQGLRQGDDPVHPEDGGRRPGGDRL